MHTDMNGMKSGCWPHSVGEFEEHYSLVMGINICHSKIEYLEFCKVKIYVTCIDSSGRVNVQVCHQNRICLQCSLHDTCGSGAIYCFQSWNVKLRSHVHNFITALSAKITIVLMSCKLLEGKSTIFGSSRLLRNTSNVLPDYTVSHSTK
jgi:hypothetical protein